MGAVLPPPQVFKGPKSARFYRVNSKREGSHRFVTFLMDKRRLELKANKKTNTKMSTNTKMCTNTKICTNTKMCTNKKMCTNTKM